MEQQNKDASTIHVLIVEEGKKPYEADIPAGLNSLQKAVGGYIEAVYPFEDPVALICNEEGKLQSLPPNRALRDDEGILYDILCGTFLVVGLTEGSFTSLSPELTGKYSRHYACPEHFMRKDGEILAIPAMPEEWEHPREVYRQSRDYALRHGELNKYRTSNRENAACRDAIEQAVAKHYRDNRLDTSCVRNVLELFGEERVSYVLANTVRVKSWDGRFSAANKAWAQRTLHAVDTDLADRILADRTHPALLDLFVTAARREMDRAAERKPSVLDRLKEGKSAVPPRTETTRHPAGTER